MRNGRDDGSMLPDPGRFDTGRVQRDVTPPAVLESPEGEAELSVSYWRPGDVRPTPSSASEPRRSPDPGRGLLDTPVEPERASFARRMRVPEPELPSGRFVPPRSSPDPARGLDTPGTAERPSFARRMRVSEPELASGSWSSRPSLADSRSMARIPQPTRPSPERWQRSVLGPAVLSLGIGAMGGFSVLLVALVALVWIGFPSLRNPGLATPSAPVGETVAFPASFAADSVVPDDEASTAQLVSLLAGCPQVGVTGLLDGVGTPDVAAVMARGRAQVVAASLVRAGLAREQIVIRTAAPSGEQTTRRVTLACEAR